MLKKFRHIIELVLPTYAVAYFFVAKRGLKLNLPENSHNMEKRYGKMIESYPL